MNFLILLVFNSVHQASHVMQQKDESITGDKEYTKILLSFSSKREKGQQSDSQVGGLCSVLLCNFCVRAEHIMLCKFGSGNNYFSNCQANVQEFVSGCDTNHTEETDIILQEV